MNKTASQTDRNTSLPKTEPTHQAEPANVPVRLRCVLIREATLGNGLRKDKTVMAYVMPAEGVTPTEVGNLLMNPQLFRVATEDAK